MFNKISISLLSLCLYIPISFGNTCDDQNRNSELCYKMKHIRSHISLLGSQRELISSNFKMYQAIGLGIENLTNTILVSSPPDLHLGKLATVRNMGSYLAHLASEGNPKAFKIANKIQDTCKSCHSKPTFPQNEEWQRLIALDWDTISKHCNKSEKNPFLCKKMFGLSTSLSYFETATQAQTINIDLATSIAVNIQSNVEGLLQFKVPIHDGGNEPLKDLNEHAKTLVRLFKENNPDAIDYARDFSKSCRGCHRNGTFTQKLSE